jgi:hypothetical protein
MSIFAWAIAFAGGAVIYKFIRNKFDEKKKGK